MWSICIVENSGSISSLVSVIGHLIHWRSLNLYICNKLPYALTSYRFSRDNIKDLDYETRVMVELTLGIWSTYIFENSGSISGLLSVLFHLISSLWLCRKLSYIRKTLDFSKNLQDFPQHFASKRIVCSSGPVTEDLQTG